MKLYTEEQLRNAMRADFIVDEEIDNLINKLTPIELPSDEEISEIAMALYGFKATSIKDVLEYKAFKRGAKMLINKIQGGNK
jgi:hypothetical protein